MSQDGLDDRADAREGELDRPMAEASTGTKLAVFCIAIAALAANCLVRNPDQPTAPGAAPSAPVVIHRR